MAKQNGENYLIKFSDNKTKSNGAQTKQAPSTQITTKQPAQQPAAQAYQGTQTIQYKPGDWMNNNTDFYTYTGNRVEPFKSEINNKKYFATVKTLYGAQGKSKKRDLEIMRDAFLLVDDYVNWLEDSVNLRNDPNGEKTQYHKSYLNAAETHYQKMLQDKLAEYQTANYGAEDWQQALAARGFETQEEKKNRLAKSYSDWMLSQPSWQQFAQQNGQEITDGEVLGDLYGALGNFFGERYTTEQRNSIGDRLSQLPMNVQEAANNVILGRGTDADKKTLEDYSASWKQQNPAEENGTGPLDREQAYLDYLRAQGLESGDADWMSEIYHAADDERDQYRQAMERAGELYGKVKSDDARGILSLNDDERGMYEIMRRYLPLTEDMTAQEVQALADERIQNSGDLLQKTGNDWQNDPYLIRYRDTVEGAREYLAQAKGTGDEEAAKDNLYFVESREKYAQLDDAADFEENSKPREDKNDSGIYAALANLKPKNMIAQAEYDMTRGILLYTRPEERKKFIYIYNTEGEQAARKYWEYMQYTIDKRREEMNTELSKNLAKDRWDYAAYMTALDIADNYTSALAFGDIASQRIGQLAGWKNTPVNRNRTFNRIRSEQSGAEEGIMETINLPANILGHEVDVADFLFGTGKSGLKSLMAGLTGQSVGQLMGSTPQAAAKIAEWASAVMMGSGAAQSAMQDAYDRTGSDDQALMAGVINGIFETLFEKVSISQYFENKAFMGEHDLKSDIKKIVVSTFTNANEELQTKIADTVADTIIMGDKSEYANLAKYYQEHGLEEPGEAEARAFWDMAFQAAEEGAGGGLMGLWFGVQSTASSRSAYSRANKDTGASIIQNNTAQELKDIGKTMPEGSKARTLADAYQVGKATPKQTGEMYRAILDQMKISSKLQQVMQARIGRDVQKYLEGNLKSINPEEMSDQLTHVIDSDKNDLGEATDAIVNLYSGKEITDEQAAAIAHNPAAMEVLRDLMGAEDSRAKAEAEAAIADQEAQAKARREAEAAAAEKKENEARMEREGRALFEEAERAIADQEAQALARQEAQEKLDQQRQAERDRIDAEYQQSRDQMEREYQKKLQEAQDIAQGQSDQAEARRQAEEQARKELSEQKAALEEKHQRDRDRMERKFQERQRLEEEYQERREALERKHAEERRAAETAAEAQSRQAEERRRLEEEYRQKKEALDRRYEEERSAAEAAAADQTAQAEARRRAEERAAAEKADRERQERQDQADRATEEAAAADQSAQAEARRQAEEKAKQAYEENKAALEREYQRDLNAAQAMAQEQSDQAAARQEAEAKAKQKYEANKAALERQYQNDLQNARDIASAQTAQAEARRQAEEKAKQAYEANRAALERQYQQDLQKAQDMASAQTAQAQERQALAKTTENGRETAVQAVTEDRDGDVTVTLSDGQERHLDEIDVDDARRELLNQSSSLPAEDAPGLVSSYQDGQDAESYGRGYKRIYNGARQGKTLNQISTIFGQTALTADQQQAAWEAGRAAMMRDQQEAKQKTAAIAQAEGFQTLDEGRTDQTGVVFASVTKKPSGTAMNQLRVLNEAAVKWGLQVRVYDTLGEDNGSYQVGTNIINIALDADAGALLRTASHECYHFIKNWNADAAKEIQTVVLDALRNTEGYDLDERVRTLTEKHGITEADALEEITADSMLDVLGREETMRRVIRENKSLARKILDWLENLIRDLQGMLESVSKYNPETKAMLKQTAEQLSGLREKYLDGIERAAENYRAAQEGATKSAVQDANVNEYMQAMQNGEDRQTALNGLISQLFFTTQEEWLRANQDADLDEALQRFADALMTYRRDGVALRSTMEEAGFAAPQDMTALSYAADQLMRMEKDTGDEVEVKHSNKDDNKYNYSDLITKPDIQITKINNPTTKDIYQGKTSRTYWREMRDLIANKQNNAVTVKTNSSGNKEVYIHNDDTGREFQINVNSFLHSADNHGSNALYAEVCKKIDEIIKNAIAVNELNDRTGTANNQEKGKWRTNYSTVLLGIAETDTEYVPVRIIVDNKTFNVIDYDIVYAIKKDSIKKGGPGITPAQGPAKAVPDVPPKIKLSDFFNLVKGSNAFAEIFSKDVANRIGVQQNRNTGIGKSLRYSKKLGIGQEADYSEGSKDLQKKAVEIFGTTNNWETTGYVLPDGKRLDFSGKREGSSGQYREEDHRAIQEAYGEDADIGGTEAMIDFMRRGAIRIMPESGGIQMQTIPTKAQLQALDSFISKMRGEVIIDIDDAEGNTVLSKEYDRGTFSRTILNEIPALFEQSTMSQSETARFHNEKYSRKTEDVTQQVADDAALHAQIRSDRDAREALELLQRLDESARSVAKGQWQPRLAEIADKYIQDTGTSLSRQAIMQRLRTLFTAMDDAKISLGEKMIFARKIMQDAVKQSGIAVEMDDGTKEALRLIRQRGFFLTDDQKSEIAETYGDVRTYVRKNFGRMAIRAKGRFTEKGSYLSLTDLWGELHEVLPGTFQMDIPEVDMPGILDAFLDSAANRDYSPAFGADAEAYATDAAYRLMLEYYDVPTGLKTATEIRKEFRQKLEDYKAKYKTKQEQKMQASKDRAAATERKQKLRGQIARDVKYLNIRNIAPTDSRHIPAALREAAIRAVVPFVESNGVWSGEKAYQLMREYSMLGDQRANSSMDAARAFDPEIEEKLQHLAQMLEGRRLSELTEAELEDVRDIVGNLKKMIEGANEMHLRGRTTTLDAVGEETIRDLAARKQRTQNKALRKIDDLTYKNMTPAYYADRVGGVIREMVQELYEGQNEWAFTVKAAKEHAEQVAEKHKLNEWINGEHLVFETERGEKIELSVGEALALYATWKRETTNRRQSANHLRIGGFTYGPKTNYKGVNVNAPHAVTAADMQQVMDFLGKEKMAYADEMVKYLSEDMAKLGNEMSMRLYGYEKFGEGYYFPYKSDRGYLYEDLTDTGDATIRQMKNAGFTKATVRNASNPIELGDFLTIWAEHVNQMAMYSAFAETTDNLNRLYNYRTSGEVHLDSATGKDEVTAPRSVKKAMENALGKEAVKYLQTLVKDVNGGVRAEDRTVSGKMLSLFKKGSVAANLSVTVQQPSAIMRAMNMVSPKYFLKQKPGQVGQCIREMETWSGVAIVKDMGRFDTGTGRSAVEWINDYVKEGSKLKAAYNLMDEWTGKAPEMADKWTWANLWQACKNEIADRMPELDVHSVDYMRAVAARFNDVCNHTQVYDSTLSKSSLMRSQSLFDKLATSFMAEPTVSFNMLLQGLQNITKPGGKKAAARAMGSFLIACVVNAMLKSLVTAGRRKDDDERTIVEKYLGELVENLGDDISPAGIISLVPIARDAVSIFQGYDVNRSDMDVVEQFHSAYQIVMNDNKTFTEKAKALLGAAGSATGVPVKNIWRDVEGVLNLMRSAPIGETSARDIKYTVLDSLPFGWDSKHTAYYQRIAQAALEGDAEAANEMRAYLEETEQVDAKAVTSGIKSATKKNVQKGRYSDDDALSILTKYLGLSDKDAFFAVDEWKSDEENYSRYNELEKAIDSGKDIPAAVKKLTEHGVKKETISSALTTKYKQKYIDLNKTDRAAAANLKAALLAALTAAGYKREDKAKAIDKWLTEKKK